MSLQKKATVRTSSISLVRLQAPIRRRPPIQLGSRSPVYVLLALMIAGSWNLAESWNYTEQYRIPISGVYIISLVCDPAGYQKATLGLQINRKDTAFVAYGQGNVIAGLCVAIPLNAGDTVRGKAMGSVQAENVYVGVGLAARSKEHFVTVRSDGFLQQGGSFTTSLYVKFDEMYTRDGVWMRYTDPLKYYLTTNKPGLYWVMARPTFVPPRSKVEFEVTPRNLKGYSLNGVSSSVSAAVFMHYNDRLNIAVRNAPFLGRNTILSFVLLEGNSLFAVGGSLVFFYAFTAHVDPALGSNYSEQDKVSWAGQTETDMGSLYDRGTRQITIKLNGTYILSLRGHALRGGSLKLVLYRNHQALFSSHAERGMASGQTAMLKLRKNDKLYVLARQGPVGNMTMISIALLFKET